MKTRNVLLITSDKGLSGFVKISALTLTKLNVQVSIEEANDYVSAVQKSRPEIIDMIIIDEVIENVDHIMLIREIRKNTASKNKKIIMLYSNRVNKEEIFNAGCDSLMSKEEFKRVVNNILTI